MKIKVKVSPERTVRNPETGEKLNADTPVEVEDSIFWRRRIQCGDVFLVSNKEKPIKPKKADAPKLQENSGKDNSASEGDEQKSQKESAEESGDEDSSEDSSGTDEEGDTEDGDDDAESDSGDEKSDEKVKQPSPPSPAANTSKKGRPKGGKSAK